MTGCCDCGDPEGWDEKGSCFRHKGFDSSKEAALGALPDPVRDRAPAVFKSLTKLLKTSLIGLIENSSEGSDDQNQARKVYECMVNDFI